MRVQVSGLVDQCPRLLQILLCLLATSENCFWVRQPYAVIDTWGRIGGITTDAAGLAKAYTRESCSLATTANYTATIDASGSAC